MAGTPRTTPGGLTPLEQLRRTPERFGLFAALRLLEQTFPQHPRFGEGRQASEDPVRLGHTPHLAFAPSDVATYEETPGGVRLEQHSFGLFGPNGPLPVHLTELAYTRRRHVEDDAIVDFLNTFQHRLISLFYRAWAEAEPATSFDRPDSDRFTMYLGALLGLASPAARNRDAVSDYAKLSRAAAFGRQTRSATALQAILEDYFDAAVSIREFTGAWLAVPTDEQCCLGAERSSLGGGAFLGSAIWDCQHKFEIVLGPLALARLETFLPGEVGLRELRALVRLFTGDEWTWQLRVLLLPDETPRTVLGKNGKLGWISWLGFHRGIADDVVIQESTAASSAPRRRN
jgi:type VI secretion system protein ImpH